VLSTSVAGRAAPLPFGRPPLAEGTLGAVVRFCFREGERSTALKEVSGASLVFQAGLFARGPLPQGRRADWIPLSGRHDSVTEGARACQVGVNPPWRAVARGGGQRGEASQVTPDLSKLGWRRPERGVVI